jgi:basic amino acid/polyamine antiporter, APA family
VSRSGVAPVRHLGRGALVAVGLNSVIGGGIFILPATVAALAGSTSLFAYGAAAAIAFGIGTTLARLATRHEASGGPYTYVEAAFGPFAGFQIGWLFCLARLTALANLLNGAALYLGALWPALGRPLPRAILILACVALVTGILVSGIRRTATAADLLALAKVLPLVALGLAGLLLVDPSRLLPAPVGPGSFARAVLLLIYAFTGFEILTVPAEESLDPRRDMPSALRLTLAAVCAIYMLVHVAALGALGDLAREPAPLAALAARLAGEPARVGMTLIASLSMAGCGLASLLGASRMLYALSSAGRIPAVLGALEPRRRTPALAAVLGAACAAVLAISGSYVYLAALSSGSRLLIYLGCCLAALRRAPASAADAAPAGPRRALVPSLTAAAIGVLLFMLEPREVVSGMIGVGAGLGLYLLARTRRRASDTQEAAS